ncbi:hypothetical protein VaNZ11_010611 [Volvox africanus]|uniref:Uncharacterized protein n=1 Tax=Volvox africanus TaxID=51714 RepID=A0ABQ5SAU7_9CHLO|nr:hypothetical protein VaNZ11_010611 [Volvox africanus]
MQPTGQPDATNRTTRCNQPDNQMQPTGQPDATNRTTRCNQPDNQMQPTGQPDATNRTTRCNQPDNQMQPTGQPDATNRTTRCNNPGLACRYHHRRPRRRQCRHFHPPVGGPMVHQYILLHSIVRRQRLPGSVTVPLATC